MKLRFAPSPTGYLHLGNARTAIVNALFAQKHGADFFLRIDDTDALRSDKKFEEAIYEDLSWLGFSFKEVFHQSQRTALYAEKAAFLKEKHFLYPCYESQEQLSELREAAKEKGKAFAYKKEKQSQDLQKDASNLHWRFALEKVPVVWDDQIGSEITIDTRHVSDPIVIRADGSFGYLLCSVIDDIDMGITHILRGQDHVTNTSIQIQMFKAFQKDIPVFAHFPLLFNASGEKFSKRTGAVSLRDLREDGILKEVLIAYLASIGSSCAPYICKDLAEQAKHFDLKAFGRSTACCDLENLYRLNMQAKIQKLRHISYEDYLHLYKKTILSKELFLLLQENLESEHELDDWEKVFMQEEIPMPLHPFSKEDLDFLQEAKECFAQFKNCTEDTFQEWTDLLKQKTGRKGKSLYHPLRVALTGMEKGPEMRLILKELPPSWVLKRLDQALKVSFD